MNQPRVAIIGAGISGLTTGKVLGDRGIDYVCFESSDRIGGNWAFGNPNGHSSAYRSLHIDTSKHRLSFKDFPMPASYPDFPHHTDIKRYLDSYADAFGLLDAIRFENAVENARRLPEGGWEIRSARGGSEHFDFLVVGNGHHWDPRLPDFPGTFAGQTIHSHSYIDPYSPIDLRDKRILIVGIGNSAADIAVEVSSKSLGTEVWLSTRSGAWIVPKYLAGVPGDRFYRTVPYIPLSWQRRFGQMFTPIVAGRPESYGLPTPNHKMFEAHPTQSVELPLRLGSGDIVPKPNITALDGHTVHFADGSNHDVDVIIYCTGYNITFPFFDPEFISAPGNRIDLYKRIFKPGIDDLAFVGFAQPAPTLFPFVECQARLVGAHIGGEYRLPDTREMLRVIAADHRKFTGHMVDRARHTQQVDYYVYERDIRLRELPAGRRRAGSAKPRIA
ncbi:flavin-containing monooxygenase [Nocardia sp. NPDC055321]